MARNRDNPPPDLAPENASSGEPGDLSVPVLPITGPVGTIEDPAPDGSAPAPESTETGQAAPPSPEGEPRRRKRRARGSARATEPQAAPAPTISPEEKALLSKALGRSFAAAARVAARRRGDHWLLSSEDESELGGAWGEALAPYLGELAKHAPIVAAIMVTYSAVEARLEVDKLKEAPPAKALQ